MVAYKCKKPKIEDTVEDEQFHTELQELQEIQDELVKINEKASEEVLEVEQEYNKVRKPVYDKRNDIIKSISDFWPTAFLSHPALFDLLSIADQKIFKHLTSLEVEKFKDMKSGYSITFNFSPNSYFEDTKLTKTLTFLDEGTTKITATPIKWKEGMGFSDGVTHEKDGNKLPYEELSFFSWFCETQQEDDMDQLQVEIAEIIKEDLWTNPLTYFNTDADEEDFDGDGEESDTEEDEEEDEENLTGETTRQRRAVVKREISS